MKRKRKGAPKTADDFFNRPKTFQERWRRGLRALSLQRTKHLRFREACAAAEIDTRFVLGWMSSAYRKGANGRYTARPHDKLLRVLKLPSAEGPSIIEVATKDSREATLIGKYWRLAGKFARTGDEAVFKQLRRRTVLATNGKRIRLVFDHEVLHLLGDAGLLNFEAIYAQTP